MDFHAPTLIISNRHGIPITQGANYSSSVDSADNGFSAVAAGG